MLTANKINDSFSFLTGTSVINMENLINFSVGVILPAAGSGERLGNDPPKQYYEIQGKPLFLYAVEAFEDIPWVARIVLVSDNVEKMQSILAKRKRKSVDNVTVIKGGSTRHRSIQEGLKTITGTLVFSPGLEETAGQCEILVVHDAVRPLVPISLLKQLVQAAYSGTGAAGLTRPLISTVLCTDQDNFLAETLDRSKFLNSETPQAFKTSVLSEAYQKITSEELERGTECLQLVLKHCGVRAKLLEGNDDLWKVTVPRDLHSAIGCITANSSNVCILTPQNHDELKNKMVPKLFDSLKWRVSGLIHIEYGVCSFNNGCLTDTINKLIMFHVEETHSFPHMLHKGLLSVIHVIVQTNILQDNKEMLYNRGQTLIDTFRGNQNFCSVVIFVKNPKESQNLVSMIATILLSDRIFANQILFV